jgi:apolipoprotein N-acyltransferase
MRALGTEPWLALTFLETLFLILLGAVLAILSVRRGWPVWFAVAWSGVEAMRGAMPFGGFTWGQLGFAVMDTPVEPVLPWTGVAGAGFVVALLGSLFAWALLEARPRPALIAAAGCALALALPAWIAPPGLGHTTGTLNVGIAQGDVPGNGDNLVAHHREVTAGQSTATRELAAAVLRGDELPPDLVVWPENSTAVDPFTDTEAEREIASAVYAIRVPVLVGAVVDDPDPGRVLNQGILYDPVSGPGERYSKRHPVPFGEFVPFRWLFRERFTERIGLVRRDMAAGTRTSPLTVERRGAPRRRDLLRRRLRRRPRQPGTPRRPARRRTDLERALHPHQPDRPAVRDQPGARPRAGALGRGGLRQRPLGRHRR